MIDTKKLISGFLILASIMSSLAFVFSGTSLKPGNRESQVQASDSGNYVAKQPPAVPANAFVEKIPEVTSSVRIASIYAPIIINDYTLPPLKPTSNLTDDLAQYITHELLAANPQGPQEDADGNMQIASPNIDDLTAAMAKVPEIKNFKVPDWNDEVAALKFSTVNNPSQADEEKYTESLGAIFNKYYLNSDLTSIAYQDPTSMDLDELKPAAITSGNALKEVGTVPVPNQFLDFHKSFLATIVYANNSIATGASAADDPLKASLIMQAQRKNFASMVTNLETQFQKSGLQQILSARPETKAGVTAFLNSLIGIKTAYALWPTWDLPQTGTWAWQIGDSIWQKIESVLLQVLKNLLINNLQMQILNWAKSGFRGTPAFIRNWKQFLENTALTAAGAVIGVINPQLCSGIRPLITLAVQNPPTIGAINNSPGLACSLNLIGSLRGFYNNFSRGGWKAYGTVFQIQNNAFGSLLDVHDSLLRQTANAKTNAQNSAVAGHGYKNQVVCPLGSTQVDENGDCAKGGQVTYYLICDENDQQVGGTYPSQSACQASVNTAAGQTCEVGSCGGGTAGGGCSESNLGACTTPFACQTMGGNMDSGTCSGNPGGIEQGQTVAPGYTNAGIVTETVSGDSQKLTVSANNIIGLVVAIANGLINRVMQGGFH